MKNEVVNGISEVQPQLAIVKRIDEFPGWYKPVEDRTERSFEAPVQASNQPKKAKNRKAKNSYKNWNLPVQPEGYLKPRLNDLL